MDFGWMLILFLKWEFTSVAGARAAGGVTAIEMRSEAGCENALETARKAKPFSDGFCLKRG
jgi:hypothetical protein